MYTYTWGFAVLCVHFDPRLLQLRLCLCFSTRDRYIFFSGTLTGGRCVISVVLAITFAEVLLFKPLPAQSESAIAVLEVHVLLECVLVWLLYYDDIPACTRHAHTPLATTS